MPDPALFPLLDPPALDGSPAAAFASHRVRASGIARFFAADRKLTWGNEQAGEDNMTALIAHFQAVRDDPNFASPGMAPSRTLISPALRRLNRGNGQVGTHGASTPRDYDMALKGLVVLLFRYADMLSREDRDFILNDLVPPGFSGGHKPSIEIVEQSFLEIDTPETENHLLMIESSRYLINQLRRDTSADPAFDNAGNGLSDWLVGYMQRVMKHDFLELNSRPYARLACSALFNLHEFAKETRMRTAAQMLLDFVMVKYAVSSNRMRRVAPFRRQQHRINHHFNHLNDLFNDQGDPVSGFFLAYTGGIDAAGNPAPFPWIQAFNGVLAGLAAYRPPPAAYELALRRDNPQFAHRFHSAIRPRLPAAGEDAEASVELYYSSPSFLISAGGNFLNSGYGSDEIDIGKDAWEQTSRAQATTLIPTRSDASFHDLLRCEPYPDRFLNPYFEGGDDKDMLRARSVNTGVHSGFMCGANMRPWPKRVFQPETAEGALCLAGHKDMMLVGWRGSGNKAINVARIIGANHLKLDGVENLWFKVTPPEESDNPPALASHNGRVFIAWTGTDEKINLMFSDDDGISFKGKIRLNETSDFSPALASHNGRLYIAWTGEGDGELNVARINLFGNTAGGFGIEGIEQKRVLGDTSDFAPAIASHNGRLFLAWTGMGAHKLNLIFSDDNGASFKGKRTFTDSSDAAPVIASNGSLFYSWSGEGEDLLNVARVVLFGNTAGGFGIEGLEGKTTLPEVDGDGPGLGAVNGRLYLGFKGVLIDAIYSVDGMPPQAAPGILGENFLTVMMSPNGTFRPDRWTFSDLSDLGFYLAVYRTSCTAASGAMPPYNYGVAYAMEKGAMDFPTFERLTRERNAGLPAQFGYGNRHDFVTADDRRFHFRVSLDDQKFAPRVTMDGEPNPVQSFTSLPLIDGPFLKALGDGHNGLIEVRHPRCDHPLVLDYGDPVRPVRRDNKAACPTPWVERAAALSALADRLNAAGKTPAARAAMIDAAQMYEGFPEEDPGTMAGAFAAAMIPALDGVGIDFSVTREELLDFLGNPVFTPYPTLAAALLQLLSPRPLAKPVFIDVIRGFYEDILGAPSPRSLAEVRQTTLKAAVLAGSNERYGENVSSFEQLLRP